MFWPNVIALKEFYATPLGYMVCHNLRKVIKGFWVEDKDSNVAGIGFATPYLLPILGKMSGVFACMPASQGVIHWTYNNKNLSVLIDETELPFPDNSLQRVLLVHALENSDNGRKMLEEIWRVLSPTGRLLVIAPNRRGIWARSPYSPFAHGQPFSYWQLRQLFTEHSFTPLNANYALFFPPSSRNFILRISSFIEKLGNLLFQSFGGVILMEGEKQIYSPIIRKSRKFVRNYIPVVAEPAYKTN